MISYNPTVDLSALQSAVVVIDGLVDNLEADRLLTVDPKIVRWAIAGSTYQDMVNITDKGKLYGVMGVLGTANSLSLKVVIDGVTLIDGIFMQVQENGCLPLNFTFNTSLLLQGKNDTGSSYFWNAYTTDAP